MILGRRHLLGAAAAALAPVPAGAAAAADFTGAIARHLAAVAPGPALLASYPEPAAPGLPPAFTTTNRDTAYTYDNALAGLALLAAGRRQDAARIGEALLLAQAHDPDGADGRLRNAYRAGPVAAPIALPGWWNAEQKRWDEDPYQVGSETGPVAWAILLFAGLADAGITPRRYRRAARRAAAWIIATCRGGHGYDGGLYGFRPHQTRLAWVSTEQNVDCAVAFRRLAMFGAANHAARFVRAMRDGSTGLHDAGLTATGSRNTLIAADACLWPILAGLAPTSASATADIAATIAALGRPEHHPRGIGFSSAGHGLWLEGTAFAALALRDAGRRRTAARFLATLASNRTPSGYALATTAPRLETGLHTGPTADSPRFAYYPVAALAPTAWAGLAAHGANPLGSVGR